MIDINKLFITEVITLIRRITSLVGFFNKHKQIGEYRNRLVGSLYIQCLQIIIYFHSKFH